MVHSPESVFETYDNTVLPALETLYALRREVMDSEIISLSHAESLIFQTLRTLADALCEFEDTLPLEMLENILMYEDFDSEEDQDLKLEADIHVSGN